MITKSVAKYFINPSLGLIPGILYVILFWTTDSVFYALGIAMSFSVIADIALRLYTKSRVCGFIFLINSLSLGISLIIKLLTPSYYFPKVFFIAIYFIIFTSIFIIITVLKKYLSIYLSRNKSIVQKTYLNDIFEIAYICQFIMTFYLFMLLIFSFREEIDHSWKNHNILYCFIPILIFCLVIIYEVIKSRKIIKQLKKEEWLPIVNETGQVTGRIARSVSSKMKNRFMHPVVRIALIHNGEIYLQKRLSTDSLDPGLYDHPFEKYMLFNHEINIAARNSISKALNMQELPFRFVIKYVFENDNTKRLTFLFVARIENDEQLKSISLLRGKFWTTKQIEDSFGDENIFSECFQLEYEYLKNVVIQAELLKKDISK